MFSSILSVVASAGKDQLAFIAGCPHVDCAEPSVAGPEDRYGANIGRMEWLDSDRVRAALAEANPGFTSSQLDRVLEALRRQHEDPEDHDRSLIAERLAWTPEQRLRALEEWLAFIEPARTAKRR